MSNPTISSSCDPEVEHIIYDCNEITQMYGDVYGRMVYLEKKGYDGKVIGFSACEKNGTLIENGMILILEDGIFIRQKHLNPDRLDFIEKDSMGRIKVVR